MESLEVRQLLAGDLIAQWQAESLNARLADGDGPSLEIVDAAVADLSVWSQPGGWQASRVIGGTPGAPSSRPGDANHDGVFNSKDLILILQRGEYEDDLARNSIWEDGDWNGDGDFDSADLVLAFQIGDYVAASVLSDMLP